MRHTPYTGAMLAGLLVLGVSMPGLASETKSADSGQPVQMQERIHAVDETWHFEVTGEGMPSHNPEVIGEQEREEARDMPSTSLNDNKVVVVNHDYVLYP